MSMKEKDGSYNKIESLFHEQVFDRFHYESIGDSVKILNFRIPDSLPVKTRKQVENVRKIKEVV